MKIISLEAVPVKLPFHFPASDALGTYHASNSGIVIVLTEGDHVGLGEISLAWFGGAHGLCHDINNEWAPLIVGEDIMNLNRLFEKLRFQLAFSKRHLLALAGVEIALVDAQAKILNIPVYKLFGGKMREAIPLTGGVHMDQKHNMIDMARQKVNEGFQELKVKVDADIDRSMNILQHIRREIPDHIKLRVDANMAWSQAKIARDVLEEWYQEGVHLAEQPLGIEQLADHRWLREHVKTLILLDESVWDVQDAKNVLEAEAADLLHVYISEAGGFHGARRIFELADLYHKQCTIGSMPEGKIGASAALHLAIAMPNLSEHPSDIRGFTTYREDVVVEDLDIQNGNLYVSERPGLGVTLDEEKLSRLRTDR